MIDPATLDPDPFRQLAAWLEEAGAPTRPMASAFALATAAGDGTPSVRMVLLRGWDEQGLRFYTDRRSRKGRDLAANPRAAGVFHWPELNRQLRVHGHVEEIDAEESLAYFSTRPLGSRLSAWASEQGAPIGSRDELELRVEAVRGQDLEDRLPPHWGGYRLVPEGFEFWRSRDDRLHDRVEYVRGSDGGWVRRRLQP